jgi:hypothetical protein
MLLKRGKNDGITIYIPKEQELKLSKLRQHFFFDLLWELSNTPHITYVVEFHLDSEII